MADNYYVTKQKSMNGWAYIILLLASFIWVSIYPVTNSLVLSFDMSFGNLLSSANPNFSYIISSIFVEAMLAYISFEIIFYIYRFLLSFKIYSFIVPTSMLKNESRMYFIYRNLIYGLFLNLCFIFPYLVNFAGFVSLVVTLSMLVAYAKHLNKKYSEPVIGHFVFKNFCYPVFAYEALVLIIELWRALA